MGHDNKLLATIIGHDISCFFLVGPSRVFLRFYHGFTKNVGIQNASKNARKNQKREKEIFELGKKPA